MVVARVTLKRLYTTSDIYEDVGNVRQGKARQCNMRQGKVRQSKVKVNGKCKANVRKGQAKMTR